MKLNVRVISSSIFICLICHEPSFAQKSAFDYRINQIQMFEITSGEENKKPTLSLEAYLYDIGPTPSFIFEAEVEQLYRNSFHANKADLNVERYILLKAHETSIYGGLENEHPDVLASPTWNYHGPVELSFSRTSKEGSNKVIFTSEPFQITFLDPENPITFARPVDFSIMGFAYRFHLSPSTIHLQDKNPADNVFQLTFLKP